MKTVAQKNSLTSEERRLVTAFRAMDDINRGIILKFSESQALSHPRRAAPVLRLIAGGAP